MASSSSDIERTRVSRWQQIDTSTPAPDIKPNSNNNSNTNDNNNNSNANLFPPPIPSSAPLPKLISATLPSLVSPPTHSAVGLLPSQGLQSLLGEVPSLLKNHAGHHLFTVPPNIPPLRIFDVTDQTRTLPHGLVGFFPNQQQQNFMPNPQNFMPNPLLAQRQQSIDLVNSFLGHSQKNQIASLNNTILSHLTNGSSQTTGLTPPVELHQQQQPLPVPPLPPDNPSVEAFVMPPPPPPPTKVNFQCLADSPMDIEDDQDEVQTNKQRGATNGDGKLRNKKVQMADELMKRALRPYFKRRRITKDEYKEIMKKGVAKLKKRHSLKAEKVEKFVSEYVQLVAARRKTQCFGHPLK